MSMILDALKRSETDRKAAETDDAETSASDPAPDEDEAAPRSSKRLWIGVGVFCVIVLGGAAAYKVLKPAPPPPEIVRQPNPELAAKPPAEDAAPAPAEPEKSEEPATVETAEPKPPAAEDEKSMPKAEAEAPAANDPKLAQAPSNPPAPETEVKAEAAVKPAEPAAREKTEPTLPPVEKPTSAPEPKSDDEPKQTASTSSPAPPQPAAPPARTLVPIAPLPPAPEPLPTPKVVEKRPITKPALAGVTPPRKTVPSSAGSNAEEAFDEAVSLDQDGQTAKAVVAYSRALRADPDFADAYMGRGWARIASGAHRDAIEDFNAFLDLEPDTAEAHFARAWAHEKLGDRRAATADYGQAISFAPGYADAHMSRGVLSFYAGSFDAAADDFAAIRDSGDDALADYALIWGYISDARSGVTRSALDAAYGDRWNRTEWPGLIYAMLRGRATDDDVLNWARDAGPGERRELECVAFFFLGQARLLAGDKPGAKAYFEKSVATGATAYRQHEAARIELERL